MKPQDAPSKMFAIATVVLAALTLLTLAAGPALEHDAEDVHFSLEASGGASGSVCMLSPLISLPRALSSRLLKLSSL